MKNATYACTLEVSTGQVALGYQGKLICYSKADHKKLWQEIAPAIRRSRQDAILDGEYLKEMLEGK